MDGRPAQQKFKTDVISDRIQSNMDREKDLYL